MDIVITINFVYLSLIGFSITLFDLHTAVFTIYALLEFL